MPYANFIFIAALLLFFGLIKLDIQSYRFNLRLITSLFFGAILGSIMAATPLDHGLTVLLLNLLSGAYFALLKMLVTPLILFSIISAILGFSQLDAQQSLAKLSAKSIGLLLFMTSLAAGIGMLLAKYTQLGKGLSLTTGADYQPKHHYTGFSDTILGMLPSNPIQAFSDQNTVAIVILALLLGTAGLMLFKTETKSAEQFKAIIDALFAIVKQVTRFVVHITPYGVFAMMALAFSSTGLFTFKTLIGYGLVMYTAMGLVFIMHAFILLLHGKPIIHHFRHAYVPLLVALTTRSSFATLPVTESTLQEKLNTSQLTSSFVPSMGATLGMNACAGVFPAVIAAMTMQVLQMPITFAVIAKVMLVSAIASLGISGIPGTAFIAASVALDLLGLPYFVLGIVLSIDPLIDMGRTATNVHGVITAARVSDISKAVK